MKIRCNGSAVLCVVLALTIGAVTSQAQVDSVTFGTNHTADMTTHGVTVGSGVHEPDRYRLAGFGDTATWNLAPAEAGNYALEATIGIGTGRKATIYWAVNCVTNSSGELVGSGDFEIVTKRFALRVTTGAVVQCSISSKPGEPGLPSIYSAALHGPMDGVVLFGTDNSADMVTHNVYDNGTITLLPDHILLNGDWASIEWEMAARGPGNYALEALVGVGTGRKAKLSWTAGEVRGTSGTLSGGSNFDKVTVGLSITVPNGVSAIRFVYDGIEGLASIYNATLQGPLESAGSADAHDKTAAEQENAGPLVETLLIENGAGACTIIVAAQEDESVRTAAEDLVYHLEKMSGARIPIVSDPSAVKGIPIYIGTPPKGIELPVDLADKTRFWPDGYLIVADGEQVILAAPRIDGVRNAVYGLLEDHLGCHWFAPGKIGEHIPTRATVKLSLAGGYQAVKPSQDLRSPWYSRHRALGPGLEDQSAAEVIDLGRWGRRNRAGGLQAFYYHNWYRIYTAELLAKEPELASFYGGRRHPEVTSHRNQVCLSNPRAVDVAVDYYIKYFNENPATDYASFSANDGRLYCECDGCKAMGSNEGERVLIAASKILERLNEVHPDKGLCFLVYRDTWKAPKKMIKAHKNLAGSICSANANNKPWMDQIKPKTDNHGDAIAYRRNVERWMSMLSKSWTYDYHGWFPGPYTMYQKLQAEQDYLAKLGVTGDGSEYISREMGTDTHMWLTWRLGWGHRVEALLEEFYPAYFGPAADDMRYVYERFENHMRTAEKNGLHEVALDNVLDLYPLDLLEDALARVAIARQKVEDDELRLARVERDERCLRATRLLMDAYTSILSYYKNVDPLGRERIIAAADAYTKLHHESGMPMPEAAALMLSPFALNKPGAFDVNDYMDESRGKTWRAKSCTGFRRGDYGIYLSPNTEGEIIYELGTENNLKINDMKCKVWSQGKIKIHISHDDGKTWQAPSIDDTGLYELTGLLAGKQKFLLKFNVRNDSGEELHAMERWRLTGNVE